MQVRLRSSSSVKVLILSVQRALKSLHTIHRSRTVKDFGCLQPSSLCKTADVVVNLDHVVNATSCQNFCLSRDKSGFLSLMYFCFCFSDQWVNESKPYLAILLWAAQFAMVVWVETFIHLWMASYVLATKKNWLPWGLSGPQNQSALPEVTSSNVS